MKMLKLILPIIICLAIIPVVFAGNTETNYFFEKETNNQLAGIDAVFYKCWDLDCSKVLGEPFQGFNIIEGNFDDITKTLNSGSNNYITVEYPGTVYPTNYATYFYKEGYLPLAYRVAGDYGTGLHFDYNNYFEQMEEAHAPVGSFTILNTVYQNEPLQINIEASLDAETRSAFSDAGIPPYFVPEQYKEEFYSAETKVTLNIYNPMGSLTHTESKTINIYMDESEKVEFAWTPTIAADGYSAEIVTEVIDNQVASTTKESTAKIFDVLPARPEDECYVILNELDTDKQFPIVNEEITISYTKISNYAASDYSKTAVPMDAAYEIKTGQHNPAGTVVYSDNKEIPATSTDTPAKQTFKWTPDTVGWYTIYVTGQCTGPLCEGKINHQETASKEIYVQAVPAFDITFTIKDIHTAEPIEDAQITVYTATAQTNSNGVAVFEGFHEGTYAYTVEHAEYHSKHGTIKIGNVDLYVDISLERKEQSPDNHAPTIISFPKTTAKEDEQYKYDVDATDEDRDILTYLLINKPSGMTIDPTNGVILWTPRNAGISDVSVMVTDGKGGVDTQDYQITVEPDQEPADAFAVDNLLVTRLVIRSEYAHPGDEIEISMDVENKGTEKLKDITISATIQELGLRRNIGPFDLKRKNEASKRIVMNIPEDVPEGEYYIRLTFSNDNVKRIKYRQVTII